MSTIETDVVVVGGGTAGIAAARAATKGDVMVVLVEAARFGEPRALLGWRVLERTVGRHLARGEAKRAPVWDEARAELARLAALREERLELRLADAGVEALRGRARFTSPRSLEVEGGAEVRFDHAVIAAGAGAAPLDGDAPDGRRLATPEQLLDLPALPPEVIVVGGGAAGAELVDALAQLADVEVTWIMDELGILPSFDRELAEALADVLLGRGVKLVHGKRVTHVTAEAHRAVVRLDGGHGYDGPLAVICAGRRAPPPSSLGLDALGLDALDVDERLATRLEHVFAAGEITGHCPSAAHAEAMGRLAGRAAAGREVRPWDPRQIPEIVRSHPQLAQVGMTPDLLAGREVVIYTARTEEALGGLLEGVGEGADRKGFVRLACDSSTGQVLGLSAAGPGAATMASSAAIALRLGATDEALADVFGDVPGALGALFAALR
ncbi:MAG: NAD(P)/FAD-dependent oxidoreductase [Sandaracinaceae bacterium]|nr:NAD(P)/FAD-dependent oxidoreductase [Sandaracinaceae bacterium]